MKTMKPNDFGKKYLVEQCQKIRLSDIIGKIAEQVKESVIKAKIEAEGHDILLSRSKTGFGGVRYWFSCPICNKQAGVLYKHPVSQILGCRQCLRLDYRKHRYSKMLENSGI
jgi:hypothetical protein